MRFYKLLVVILICFVIISLPADVRADPPKPTAPSSGQGGSFPPDGDSLEPGPVQNAAAVLDPATASVTRMTLAEDEETLVPGVPAATPPTPIVKGNDDPFAPGPILAAKLEGGNLKTVPDSANTANDLSIAGAGPTQAIGQEIGVAASTIIEFENFESTNFLPTGSPEWSRSGPPVWDDVDCFPIESTGFKSAWAADLTGLDPCSATPDNYPSNMNAWLIYGPFSLADAQAASLDFFYRLDSELGGDFFKWMASTNGIDFFGQQISGTYLSGPFNNGYNFVSFDLTNVHTLGDLSGEPEVWIAFIFQSDSDTNTGQGAFIDFITLRKNTDPRVYLTQENFDVDDFPNALWDSFDNDGPENGDYRWDDVSDTFQGPHCPPRSGDWSMWPADEGTNGLDPCSAGDDYPNNARSWLVHGPFNLEGASEAWVDFYFRNVSETNYDTIAWLASKDGINFEGFGTSGTYIDGPSNNGYNLRRFYLSYVGPTVGDLRGETSVWLAFIFQSDNTVTAQGPFIDDVSIVVERPSAAPGVNTIYLPLLVKSEISPAKVYVTNSTGGTLTYRIFGPPEGNINCSVPNGAQKKFCGSFTPGAYDWRADATCGSKTGTKFFRSGDNFPTPFQCN